MTVRLLLFGSPLVVTGNKSLALAFERRTQLLAFLALKRGWAGRAELAAMLWPEQQSKSAYANLRKTLFRLQSLNWAPQIGQQGAALRFEAETDVSIFEAALRERRIADALTCRRGELLAGFDDDSSESWSSWLNFERERLRVAWRGAALERLTADIDADEGVELSARLLEVDPLDEAALRAHMSWLARGGQGGRARQAYRDFVDRLARELGLAPGAELKALHDSLGAMVAAPAVPVSPAATSIENGFVGRAIELRKMAELLAQDDCRLLSLVGPGGVGKTRLSRQAIQQFAPGFADGVAFVSLEDIASASEFGGRLAREVGLRLAGADESLDQVIDFLRGRQMLLALDNFEHLAADASILERLLRACARVKLIVTSRVRLAVSMEWLLPLDGLPCPETADLDHFEAFDAVRLFVQAARRVEPALIPAAEATSIIHICRRVEGLPLALELAAAWTRVLPCDAIAAELDQGTDLLHAADAAHPARHASFETVFDQSWRLLSAVERDALSRLAVFRGGFTAQAARAVAEAPPPVLGALADKSLLRKDQSRLHLHPLVQQLAGARLGDGAAGQSTHAAHAAYFHRNLAQLKAAVGTGARASLQWVDDEFENCRRAWSWSIAHGEAEALTRSAATLLDFCDYRGRFEDGLALFRQAIHSPLGQSDQSFQALMLARASHLEYRLDRYTDAEATATRALAATRQRRSSETGRQAVIVLATCAFRRGRLAEAKRYFEQTLRFATADTQAHALAVTYDHLALIEKAMGQYAEALRLSLQSLAEHRRLGDSAGEALCLNNLASLYLVLNENEAAGTHLRQGLAICERDGIVSTRSLIFANLTEVALRAGDLNAAEALAERALDVAGATGHRAVVSWVQIKRARIALRHGDIAAARSTLADGLGQAISLGLPTLKFEAVVCFADLLEAQGESPGARQVLAFAADHPSANAAIRDHIRPRLVQWPPTQSPQAAWPAIELDEFVHRIVAESGIAHAPLIATLRGTH